MKYVKHMTLKEWNRFNKIQKDFEGNFIPPGNEFQFRNHFTGKMESLQTITGQEILLSKYKIIIDDFELKWIRRYHKITKIINMKNFDKGIKVFDKSLKTFSKDIGTFEINIKEKKKKSRKNISVDEQTWGKKSKKTLKIWSDRNFL